MPPRAAPRRPARARGLGRAASDNPWATIPSRALVELGHAPPPRSRTGARDVRARRRRGGWRSCSRRRASSTWSTRSGSSGPTRTSRRSSRRRSISRSDVRASGWARLPDDDQCAECAHASTGGSRRRSPAADGSAAPAGPLARRRGQRLNAFLHAERRIAALFPRRGGRGDCRHMRSESCFPSRSPRLGPGRSRRRLGRFRPCRRPRRVAVLGRRRRRPDASPSSPPPTASPPTRQLIAGATLLIPPQSSAGSQAGGGISELNRQRHRRRRRRRQR